MSVSKITKTTSALGAIITVALGLTLSGCSTTPVAAPTPYKSASTKAGYGYSSEKIQENEYKILFSAKEFKKTRVEYFVEHSFNIEETIPA